MKKIIKWLVGFFILIMAVALLYSCFSGESSVSDKKKDSVKTTESAYGEKDPKSDESGRVTKTETESEEADTSAEISLTVSESDSETESSAPETMVTETETAAETEKKVSGSKVKTSETVPETEPEEEDADSGEQFKDNYVLNKNTKKFHYPYCSSVKSMKSKNRIDFYGTPEEIEAMGYSPCGRCKP